MEHPFYRLSREDRKFESKTGDATSPNLRSRDSCEIPTRGSCEIPTRGSCEIPKLATKRRRIDNKFDTSPDVDMEPTVSSFAFQPATELKTNRERKSSVGGCEVKFYISFIAVLISAAALSFIYSYTDASRDEYRECIRNGSETIFVAPIYLSVPNHSGEKSLKYFGTLSGRVVPYHDVLTQGCPDHDYSDGVQLITSEQCHTLRPVCHDEEKAVSNATFQQYKLAGITLAAILSIILILFSWLWDDDNHNDNRNDNDNHNNNRSNDNHNDNRNDNDNSANFVIISLNYVYKVGISILISITYGVLVGACVYLFVKGMGVSGDMNTLNKALSGEGVVIFEAKSGEETHMYDGVDLFECPWMGCSSARYVWMEHKRLLEQQKQEEETENTQVETPETSSDKIGNPEEREVFDKNPSKDYISDYLAIFGALLSIYSCLNLYLDKRGRKNDNEDDDKAEEEKAEDDKTENNTSDAERYTDSTNVDSIKGDDSHEAAGTPNRKRRAPLHKRSEGEQAEYKVCENILNGDSSTGEIPEEEVHIDHHNILLSKLTKCILDSNPDCRFEEWLNEFVQTKEGTASLVKLFYLAREQGQSRHKTMLREKIMECVV